VNWRKVKCRKSFQKKLLLKGLISPWTFSVKPAWKIRIFRVEKCGETFENKTPSFARENLGPQKTTFGGAGDIFLPRGEPA